MIKFLKHYRFTLVRRAVQLGVMGLFIAGNLFGVKVLKGNLSGSEFLGFFNLADPLALLQLFLAGGGISLIALIGAAAVFVPYALLAPRLFCGWICPINILTDIAAWARKMLGFHGGFVSLTHNFRYGLLVLCLVASAAGGFAAWESVSFVGAFVRALVVLSGEAAVVALVVVCFEFLAGKRVLCGRICPLGAFWAAASRFSLIRVGYDKSRCTSCGRCHAVCPEERSLKMVGKHDGYATSECISCGRCVEVCGDNALEFSLIKFAKTTSPKANSI